MPKELIVYVDVDDTMVRSAGSKRIPVPEVIRHVRNLKSDGATLYCWSSGGAEYAKSSAKELGVEECFEAFLPKPNILVDDQNPSDWKRFHWVHPVNCSNKDFEKYLSHLES